MNAINLISVLTLLLVVGLFIYLSQNKFKCESANAKLAVGDSDSCNLMSKSCGSQQANLTFKSGTSVAPIFPAGELVDLTPYSTQYSVICNNNQIPIPPNSLLNLVNRQACPSPQLVRNAGPAGNDETIPLQFRLLDINRRKQLSQCDQPWVSTTVCTP